MAFSLHALPKDMQDSFVSDKFCRITYSQFGEDVIVQELLDRYVQKEGPGFYVDIGAFSPHMYSNTKILHSLGWRGINIDANHVAIAAFQMARPDDINLCCGIAPTYGKMTYHQFSDAPAVNTLSAEMAKANQEKYGWKMSEASLIDVYPINAILDKFLPENQTIDFMDIDIEGMDIVIKTLDLYRYRPAILSIEIRDCDILSVRESDILKHLTENDYSLVSVNMESYIFLENKFKKYSSEKEMVSALCDFVRVKLQSGATSEQIEKDLIIQRELSEPAAKLLVGRCSNEFFKP